MSRYLASLAVHSPASSVCYDDVNADPFEALLPSRTGRTPILRLPQRLPLPWHGVLHPRRLQPHGDLPPRLGRSMGSPHVLPPQCLPHRRTPTPRERRPRHLSSQGLLHPPYFAHLATLLLRLLQLRAP